MKHARSQEVCIYVFYSQQVCILEISNKIMFFRMILELIITSKTTIQNVKMETFVWRMVILQEKAEWRYATTILMGQCVMMSGEHMMLQ